MINSNVAFTSSVLIKGKTDSFIFNPDKVMVNFVDSKKKFGSGYHNGTDLYLKNYDGKEHLHYPDLKCPANAMVKKLSDACTQAYEGSTTAQVDLYA